MKRIFHIILITFIASGFTACGGDDSEKKENTELNQKVDDFVKKAKDTAQSGDNSDSSDIPAATVEENPQIEQESKDEISAEIPQNPEPEIQSDEKRAEQILSDLNITKGGIVDDLNETRNSTSKSINSQNAK